jgi:hypothetical protein
MAFGPASSSGASDRRLASCEFRFPAEPGLVSIVRRFVSDFCQQTLGSRALAERVALTTHELLENTVAYSTNGESSLHVEVATDGPRAVVSLRTRNQASPEDIEALSGRLREIQEAPDAFAYYQMVMRRNSGLRDKSGLGLARVFAETQTQMSMQREADDCITVLAQTCFDLSEGQ